MKAHRTFSIELPFQRKEGKMSDHRTGSRTLAAALAVAIVALGCSSTPNDDSKSLTISETRNGKGMSVSVSKPLARSLLEGAIGAELQCGAELDDEFASMLRTLDREGRGSRVTIRDEDGVITARRSGSSLRLDIRDADGGGRLEVKMPWAVAECLLDGSSNLSPRDADSIRIKVAGSQGGSFELAVD
jgi:hypothetical protein